MSRYVDVSIVDPEGNPRRTFKFKYKNGGTFVEAVNGEQYGIRMTNKSATQPRGVYVYVDGHLIMGGWFVPNGTTTLTEVRSKVFTVGGVTKEVYRPLTFAYPEIKEGEEGTSLPDDVAERLGCIEVEVYEVEDETTETYKPLVVAEECLKVAMTEEQATMKGAFRSVTALGATERVVTVDASTVKTTALGKHLGDVKLHYGSRAMLLFKGVPPQIFMNSNTNNNTAADDDDDDEQSDSDSEPRSGGRKRGHASGPLSLPPAGPLRSSSRMANKRLKGEN